MTIIAIGILSKEGKILLSRQFVELKRSHVESIFHAFPRLIRPNQQHTVVDGEHVRYLYQMLDSALYLVLTSTKTSNIISDIQTLNIISSVLIDIVNTGIDSDNIERFAFELIAAIDEIVSPFLGCRDSSSPSQVLSNLKMDSQAEKIEEMIAKDKEKEAKAKAKEKIKQLEHQKREAIRNSISKPLPQSIPITSDSIDRERPDTSRPILSKGGMQLSSKKSAIPGLSEYIPKVSPPPNDESISMRNSSISENIKSSIDGIQISAEEKITMIAHHDGGIDQFEIKGDLNVFISDEEWSFPSIQLSLDSRKEFQYKTHPNIDKSLFTDKSILRSKDQNKPFPIKQSLAVLKWRFASTDEHDLPISITCWPNQNHSGGADVIVDYQLEKKYITWDIVQISIPIPSNNAPIVNQDSSGLRYGYYEFDENEHTLHWIIPDLSLNNSSGNLEFTVNNVSDLERFFPLNIRLKSTTSVYCPIEVSETTSTKDPSKAIEFRLTRQCISEEYTIV